MSKELGTILDYFCNYSRKQVLEVLDYMKSHSKAHRTELENLGPGYQENFNYEASKSLWNTVGFYLKRLHENPNYIQDLENNKSKTIFDYFQEFTNEQKLEVLDYMKNHSKAYRTELENLGPDYQGNFNFADSKNLYSAVYSHLRKLKENPNYIQDLDNKKPKLENNRPKTILDYFQHFTKEQKLEVLDYLKQYSNYQKELLTLGPDYQGIFNREEHPKLYDRVLRYLKKLKWNPDYIQNLKLKPKLVQSDPSTESLPSFDIQSFFQPFFFIFFEPLLEQLEWYNQESYQLLSLIYEAYLKGNQNLVLTEQEQRRVVIGMNQLWKLYLNNSTLKDSKEKILSFSTHVYKESK